ncbi:MAG: hypothetical protein H0V62_05900 [Gammaproteobacteria bacterium]|nr:hypothetical protein [Gammaproteobacteria bacterium]
MNISNDVFRGWFCAAITALAGLCVDCVYARSAFDLATEDPNPSSGVSARRPPQIVVIDTSRIEHRPRANRSIFPRVRWRERWNNYANDSGLQIIYDATVTDNARTQGVKGHYVPELALQILLACTGVNYEFTSEHTVALRRMSEIEPVFFDEEGRLMP